MVARREFAEFRREDMTIRSKRPAVAGLLGVNRSSFDGWDKAIPRK